MRSTKPTIIKLLNQTGSFAENKDTAQKIRIKNILPTLNKGGNIILDFSGIDSTTQSFTHALVSDLIRTFGSDFFNRVTFKNCNKTVQRIIKIVSEYMQTNHIGG